MPTVVPMPNKKSIKKKNAENTCGAISNFEIASGYESNAIPDPPWITWERSSLPVISARLPRMPKTITPAVIDVKVSSVDTTKVSLLSAIRFEFYYLIYKKLPINILVELVERRVGYYSSKANGQREENLRNSSKPNLKHRFQNYLLVTSPIMYYFRVQQLIELWSNKVQNTFCRTWQSYSTNQ